METGWGSGRICGRCVAGVGSFRAWYLKAFLIVVVALILLKVLKSRALRRIGYRLQESVDLEKLAPELAKKLQERKM